MSDTNCKETSAAASEKNIIPAAPSPFTDFPGLVRHLPMYGARTLRTLVMGKVIPSVRPPGTRKLGFHLPSVEAALLRHQHGGPPDLLSSDPK